MGSGADVKSTCNSESGSSVVRAERYPMCKDQKAQIDCRVHNCFYNHGAKCNNESPAITLNLGRHFNCWSFEP